MRFITYFILDMEMPREGSSLRQKYTPESEGQSLTSAREQGAGVQGRKGVHVVAFQVKSRERGGILKISARDMNKKERKAYGRK